MSRMVARAGLGQDSAGPNTLRQTTGNQKLPTTSSRLRPREGATALWEFELNELIATHGLSKHHADAHPPTIDILVRKLPYGTDSQQVDQLYHQVLAEWYSEATLFYHLVIGCLDLSGPMQEVDLRYITKHFHIGDYRHGKGLLAWARDFKTSESVEGQLALSDRVTKMEILGTPTLPSFSCDVTNLLHDWCKIDGNDLSKPATFYYHLLRSMAKCADGSKVNMIRSWIAVRVTDRHPSLDDPEMFVQTLILHAGNCGLSAEQKDSVNIYASQNNCKLCSSGVCINPGGKPETCLCFNNMKPIPKKATDNQAGFIKDCREYIGKTNCTTLKGVKGVDIRKAIGKTSLTHPPAGTNNAGSGGQQAPGGKPPAAAAAALVQGEAVDKSENKGEMAFKGWLASMTQQSGDKDQITAIISEVGGDATDGQADDALVTEVGGSTEPDLEAYQDAEDDDAAAAQSAAGLEDSDIQALKQHALRLEGNSSGTDPAARLNYQTPQQPRVQAPSP